ncbi:MAG: peptidase dimerization domain-containing protein [Thermomicrobiales bacterium]
MRKTAASEALDDPARPSGRRGADHRADEAGAGSGAGGSLVMRLTVPGKSAHGAVRDEGVSAIEKFIPIFQDLLAWEAERNRTLDHPLYAHLTNKAPFSIGVVRAGTWASTVAESLVAEGRLGLVPGEDVDEFRRAVEDRISGVAWEDAWLRDHPPTVDWFGGQFAPGRDAGRRADLAGGHRRPSGGNRRRAGHRRRPLWRRYAAVYPARRDGLRDVWRWRRAGCPPYR